MNRAGKKIWSALLACALALGVAAAPAVQTTAYGAAEIQGGIPNITIGTNSGTPTTVAFGGKQWVVIGYNGTGVNSENGNMTLLLKNGESYGTAQFDSSGASNEYKDSTLQGAMDAKAATITNTKEAGFILPRNLTGGSGNYNTESYDSDHVAGDPVTGARFWPLSVKEAKELDEGVRKFGAHWWLRSPGFYDLYAALVYNDGAVHPDGGPIGGVSYDHGIRPAFKLNLSSVLFTSSAASGGKPALSGNLVGAVAPTDAIKLTLFDDTQVLNVYGLTGGAGTNTLTFTYDAATATTGQSQHISCVLEQGGNVKYYGKLEDLSSAATGTVDVPLTGVANDTYTLKIFSEQANGNLYTDFASQPFEIEIEVSGSNGTPTDTVKPTVSGITPVNGATGVATSGSIVITFNEAMNPAVNGSVTLTGGSGTVNAPDAWSNENKTYTIVYSGLEDGTAYTINISGFKDVAGNEIASGTTSVFTTAEGSTPLALTASNLPDGVEDVLYSQSIAGDASGGVQPYTFALDSGNLPNGLTLSGNGVISGTPTAEGDYGFTVEVTDDAAQTNTADYTIKIHTAGTPAPPAATPTTLALDVYDNPTGTVTLSLGMSGDASTPLATKATASSSDDGVATVPNGDLTGQVTVTAHSEGTATITFIFDDADSTEVDVTVNVADSTLQGNTHTVTFDPAGGIRTGGGELTQTVENGRAAVAPTVERSGYTFTGWDRDFSYVTGNMIVTAQWSENGSTPPTPPSGSSDRNSDSGSTYTAPAVVRQTQYTIDAAEMRRLMATAEKNGWDFVRASHDLPATVKADGWKLLKDYRFIMRTMADKAVQVQLTFPAPSKLTADMQVSGYVKGKDVDKTRKLFEKWFQGKVQVIHLEHTGSFGQAVEIAAKIDLAGMDAENLYIYRYDKQANSYNLICQPGQNPAEYRIDKNGYLHFTADKGGDFVVSEGALTGK